MPWLSFSCRQQPIESTAEGRPQQRTRHSSAGYRQAAWESHACMSFQSKASLPAAG